MESFRLCWQMGLGGRTECTAPTSQNLAQFRLREQMTSFPAIRSWISEDGSLDQPPMSRDSGE